MKKTTYILITILISLTPTYGQELSKNYIDEFINKTFLPAELDSTILYVLNGESFDQVEIKSKLTDYNISQLYGISFIDGKIASTHFDGNRNGIILLVVGKQKRKQVNELFKTTISKYSPIGTNHSDDNQESGEPVLMINGEIVKRTDCYKSINEMRVKNVKTINIINQPVSQDHYGPNGKYGLIMIWLK